MSLLSEAKVQRELQNLAQDLERGLQEVRGRRCEAANPQTLFKQFKDNVHVAATKHAKTLMSKIESTIKHLQRELEKTLNRPGTDERGQYDTMRDDANVLQQRIRELEH